jgi:hypothetical protein
VFVANFYGKDSELDENGKIEIALINSGVPCVDGAKCLAECGHDDVSSFFK